MRQDFEGIGLQSLFQGTILREFSLEQEEETDSGIRKKIFVRWDLICQILNQKVIPEYTDKSSLVELTYLTKNTDTYKKGTPEKGGKFKGDGFYIPYSKTEGGAIIPFDSIGFNDKFFNDLVKYNSEEVEGSSYDGYRSKKPLRMKLGDALDTLESNYIEEEKQGMISQFGRNTLIDLQVMTALKTALPTVFDKVNPDGTVEKDFYSLDSVLQTLRGTSQITAETVKEEILMEDYFNRFYRGGYGNGYLADLREGYSAINPDAILQIFGGYDLPLEERIQIAIREGFMDEQTVRDGFKRLGIQ